MKSTRGAILLLMTAAALATGDRRLPAQGEPPPPRSLDEKLLDELGGDPIDELDRDLPGPGDRQVEPGDPAGPRPDDLGARLQGELGAAGVAEDDNLLLEVARRMRRVEGRIAQNDSGPATRGEQRQIIADLDQLIEQARKQCQGGKPGAKASQGSSGGQPKEGSPGTKPGTTPGVAPVVKTGNGQIGKPDRQRMQTLMERLWRVALPQQQREQFLQQNPFDEFLPKYELLIEQYYRRLAEEEDDQ